MSNSIEEQWRDLCQEFDRARDALTEAMSQRGAGAYQNADFWRRLEEAQDLWIATKREMDDFRKSHSKS